MLSIGGLMTIAGSAVFAASFYPWYIATPTVYIMTKNSCTRLPCILCNRMVIISRCMQGIGVG